MPSSCCYLSTLSFLCTCASSSWYRFFLFPDCCVSLIIYPFFCDLTDPIVSLATSSRTVLVPFQRSSGVTSFQCRKPVGHLCCKLYCFVSLEFLQIQRRNAALSLSFSQSDFQHRHKQLMICATVHQACFPSLRNWNVVYLIPGVAIRRGPCIQPP